jgi:hypothetical protein
VEAAESEAFLMARSKGYRAPIVPRGGKRRAGSSKKRWATGMKPGWKNRARKRGVSISQIRKKQRRLTAKAGVKYRPYSPGKRKKRNTFVGG